MPPHAFHAEPCGGLLLFTVDTLGRTWERCERCAHHGLSVRRAPNADDNNGKRAKRGQQGHRAPYAKKDPT